MFERKEPIINEDSFYTENLDAEQEAFLKKKKNEDLKNALRTNGFNKFSNQNKNVKSIFRNDSSIRKEKNEHADSLSNTENKELHNHDWLEDTGLSGFNKNMFVQDNVKDVDTNFVDKIEAFITITEDVNRNKKYNANTENIRSVIKDEVMVESLIGKALGQSEIFKVSNKLENKIEKESLDLENAELEENIEEDTDFNGNSKFEEEYKDIDIVELSKIYFYAEMLSNLVSGNIDEIKEEESFVSVLIKEFEKLINKENNYFIKTVYENSPRSVRFSSVMESMHMNSVFMNYIKYQSDLFEQIKPERNKDLYWYGWYKSNYESKVWLQPKKYSEDGNETLTPWTKSGLLIWAIGIFLGLVTTIFYSFTGERTILEIFSPLFIIMGLLGITSLLDMCASMFLKSKYTKFEKQILIIKEKVSDISIGKKEINPLMFDVCYHYLKLKRNK